MFIHNDSSQNIVQRNEKGNENGTVILSDTVCKRI